MRSLNADEICFGWSDQVSLRIILYAFIQSFYLSVKFCAEAFAFGAVAALLFGKAAAPIANKWQVIGTGFSLGVGFLTLILVGAGLFPPRICFKGGCMVLGEYEREIIAVKDIIGIKVKKNQFCVICLVEYILSNGDCQKFNVHLTLNEYSVSKLSRLCEALIDAGVPLETDGLK